MESILKDVDFEKLEKIKTLMEQAPTDAQKELLKEIYERANDYAAMRASWETMSLSERLDNDEKRRRLHDLFIKSLNRLSIKQFDEKTDNEWLDMLGNDRKEIGDYACFLTFCCGIKHR